MIEKVRILAPNEKAIQILSKKHAKIYSTDIVPIDDVQRMELDININTLSRRELLELRRVNSPLDVVHSTATDILDDCELATAPQRDELDE